MLRHGLQITLPERLDRDNLDEARRLRDLLNQFVNYLESLEREPLAALPTLRGEPVTIDQILTHFDPLPPDEQGVVRWRLKPNRDGNADGREAKDFPPVFLLLFLHGAEYRGRGDFRLVGFGGGNNFVESIFVQRRDCYTPLRFGSFNP